MAHFEAYVDLDKSIFDGLSEEKKKEWNYGIERKHILPLDDDKYMVHVDYYMSFMTDLTKDKKDPYGIDNVNFSLIDLDDDRWQEYKEQRLQRGFDNSELWNFDVTIAKFILPRLKAFKELSLKITPGRLTYDYEKQGYSQEDANELAEKEWNNILDRIIWTFENYEDRSYEKAENFKEAYREYSDKIKEGLMLFAKWFMDLCY